MKRGYKQQYNLPLLVLFIGICQFAGIIGSLFTFSAIPTWYVTLTKPIFSPPNWLFGPAWILLYTLMGIAAYLIWQKGYTKSKIREALGFFSVQLVLNSLWSIIFFGFHSPLVALFEIFMLWTAILATIYKFYPLSKPAAYLLFPYLAWVTFATILNAAIVFLN
ncbi:TPA: TspO protein [Patescibacteria group bacterium]|uniref:Integral membrane protein n=1 Tax=Candidatus Gottesmanbacteria bacterium GW2011_GWA1_43_11 TaxID=1618436 RepID=A0A0G1CIP3_9BACT|nr:MAG: Integral membrane protein [Candidatus Gottesmanbacteria bacterium GW2011_GWA1_43_11]HCS79301.1 TspO protein [Patescibacteria group bacterium]